MTNEQRKALVERLRAGDLCDLELAPTVADQIEADGKEIERLTYGSIHTCHDECQRIACVQRRRIAELEEENAKLRECMAVADTLCDATQRLVNSVAARAALGNKE